MLLQTCTTLWNKTRRNVEYLHLPLVLFHTITMNGTEAFKPEKDLKAHTIDTIEANI